MLLICMIVVGLVLDPAVPSTLCSSDTCVLGRWDGGSCTCASFDCSEVCAGCPSADVQCQPGTFGAPFCSCKSDSTKCFNMPPPSLDANTVIVGAANVAVSAVDAAVEVIRVASHPCINLKYSIACSNGVYRGCAATGDFSPSGTTVLLSTNGDFTTATRKVTAMSWSNKYQPSFLKEEVRVIPRPVVLSITGCANAATAVLTCGHGGVLEFGGYDFPVNAEVVFTLITAAPVLEVPFNQVTLESQTSTLLSGSWQPSSGSTPSCTVLSAVSGFSSRLTCNLTIPSTTKGIWGISIRPLVLPAGSPLTDLLDKNAIDSNVRFMSIVSSPIPVGVITNVYLDTCMHPDVLQFCTDGTLVLALANAKLVTSVVFTSSTQSTPTCDILIQNSTHVQCRLVLPQGDGTYGISVMQGTQSEQWKYFLRGRGGVLSQQGYFLFAPPPEDGKEWSTAVMVSISHNYQLPQGYRCLLLSRIHDAPFQIKAVGRDEYSSSFYITEQALLASLQGVTLSYGAVAVQLYYANAPASDVAVAYYNITADANSTSVPVTKPSEGDWVIPATCSVSEWSAWSECSKPCNTGSLYRNRTVLDAKLPPWLNPSDIGCPPLSEVEACNFHSCLCNSESNDTQCNEAGRCNSLGMCDCRSGLTGAECDILENGWRAELLGNLLIVVICVALLHSILSKQPMTATLALIEAQILTAFMRSPCNPIDITKAAEYMTWVILFPRPSSFSIGDLTWVVILVCVPVLLHCFMVLMLNLFGSKELGPPLARLMFPCIPIVIVSWFICPLSFNATKLISDDGDIGDIVFGVFVLSILLAGCIACTVVFANLFKLRGKSINARYTQEECHLDGFYSEVVYSNMSADGSRALHVVPSRFWSSANTSDPTFKRRWSPMFTSLKDTQTTFLPYLMFRAISVSAVLGIKLKGNSCAIPFIIAAAVHLVFLIITLVKSPWCDKLLLYFECPPVALNLLLCLMLGAVVLVDFNTKSTLSDAVQYTAVASLSIMLLISFLGGAVWLLCRLYHASSLKDAKAYDEFNGIKKAGEVDESVASEALPKPKPPPELVPVNPLLMLDDVQKRKNQRVIYSAVDNNMKCMTTLHPNTTVCDLEKQEAEEAMAAQRLRRQEDFSKVVYIDTNGLQEEVDLPEIGASVLILPSAGIRHEKVINCTGKVVQYDTAKSHYVTGVMVDVQPHKGVRRFLPQHLQVLEE